MRVLVADDHNLFRDGIVSLLEAGGHEVVGQANNGEQAVALAASLHPELVLMDIHMPVMNGVEALKRIKAEQPGIYVVILTASEDEHSLLESIHAGADGYLLKHLNAAEFFQMLENLKLGQPALSSAMAARLFKHVGQAAREPRRVSLTERELAVLKLVAAGKSNHEIAEALLVSENTVKFRLKNILQKLQVSNRTEAAMVALQRKLI